MHGSVKGTDVNNVMIPPTIDISLPALLSQCLHENFQQVPPLLSPALLSQVRQLSGPPSP